MPTYRRAVAADAPVIVTFYNAKGLPAYIARGYLYAQPFTQVGVTADLVSARQRWYLAFDNSNNLRGLIQCITSKMPGVKEAWVSHFALDSAISLASARSHFREVCRLLWQQLPDGYSILINEVRPGATLVVEYCEDATTGAPRFSEAWTDTFDPLIKHYRATVERLRSVA